MHGREGGERKGGEGRGREEREICINGMDSSKVWQLGRGKR